MRISCLLVILLWGLVSVGEASDSAQQLSSAQATVSSSNTDRLSPSPIQRYGFVQGTAGDAADLRYPRSASTRDGDVTCFTMHTFLVKRESPRSEATEPAGEATCLSGPRYSVRKVEESGKVPSR